MKKKYFILLGLVLVASGLALWYFFFKEKPIQYVEAQIKKSNITLKILATGSVQPENRLQIKSPLAGRAETIHVQEGQKVKKGQILAWVSSTERAVLLDSARSLSPEEIKKWEDIYKPTPIIAPLSGTIILRSIEPGQTFTTNDAILVMADRLTIQAQVDETDLAQITLNQKTQINLDAYPEKNIEARVHQIAYEAKTVNNVTTYTIDVLPNEKIDFLRSGMTANVTFFGQTKENILVIPNEFIKYKSGKPSTEVKENNKTETKEIKLGLTDGKVTEVVSGLNENDTVLLAVTKDNKAKSSLFSGPGTSGRRR